MEGVGQQKTNRRGAKKLRDGKRSDKTGGKVYRTPTGGSNAEWTAIPSPRDDSGGPVTIEGIRWRSACCQYLDVVLRRGPGSHQGMAMAADEHLGIDYVDLFLREERGLMSHGKQKKQETSS